MRKRLLSALLVLCMVLTLLPGTAFAAETSGKCGDSINWYLQNDGTLLLDGNGETYDYGWYWFKDEAPWYDLSDQIKGINVQGNITYLGTALFSSCTNAVGITLPGSIEEIASDALPQYGACQYVIVGSGGNFVGDGGVLYVKDAAQYNYEEYNGKYGLVYYPPALQQEKYTLDSKTEVIAGSFSSNPYLEEVTLNGKLVEIGYSAFAGCSNLRTVNIPYGLKKIENMAFSDCASLTDISLPESLISLGQSAFAFCDSLKKIIVPASVTEIDNGVYGGDGLAIAPDEYKEWYFLGNAPKMTHGYWIEGLGIVNGEHSLLSTRIYYPENASGWAEFIKNFVPDSLVKIEFVPYSSIEPDDIAAIKELARPLAAT